MQLIVNYPNWWEQEPIRLSDELCFGIDHIDMFILQTFVMFVIKTEKYYGREKRL